MIRIEYNPNCHCTQPLGVSIATVLYVSCHCTLPNFLRANFQLHPYTSRLATAWFWSRDEKSVAAVTYHCKNMVTTRLKKVQTSVGGRRTKERLEQLTRPASHKVSHACSHRSIGRSTD